MQHIVLEREFDPGITIDDFMAMAHDGMDCMNLYRVQWHESLMATDGSRLLCRFEAPDAEAVRLVTRESLSRARSAWTGTVHDTGRVDLPTVVVERRFTTAVTLEVLQAKEDAAAWCLEQHQVTFLRTFFSEDRKRMICLYRAPDAESVRRAQRQADMPVERAWSCRGFTAADFGG
jgi:Nickel responsive protein SCO4226-like